MIMDIVKRMGRFSQEWDFKVAVSPHEGESDFVSKSLSIINMRRLSKTNVLAMMRMLIPQMGEMVGNANPTVREILGLFGKYASAGKIDNLIRWLKPGLTQPDGDPVKPVLNRALSLIRKRQLSKKEIVMKLGELSSEIEDLCRGDRLSLEEVLNIFIEGTSRNEFIKFMNSLEGEPVSGDDYLKGIMDES